MDTNTPNTQDGASNIPPSELKMPEEQLNATAPQEHSSHVLVPVLVGILIVLLLALGALVVWGEEVVDYLFPQENEMADTMPAEDMQSEERDMSEKATTTEEAFTDIESELDATDFKDFDAELESIDGELDAEASAN